MANARGFIFTSLEPFGIAPIEALSAVTPVIALEKGGSLDYILDGKNGIFFKEQTVKSLERSIDRFQKINFDAKEISKTAEKFSDDNFKENFAKIIREKNNEK